MIDQLLTTGVAICFFVLAYDELTIAQRMEQLDYPFEAHVVVGLWGIVTSAVWFVLAMRPH